MSKDTPLKQFFHIQRDIAKLWIRNIEKFADVKEVALANRTAVKLMNAGIWTIDDCLQLNDEQLMAIKKFDDRNKTMLFQLLRRIMDSPEMLKR